MKSARQTKYNWDDMSIPEIDHHSLCKHKILKEYIIQYIRVCYSKIQAFPSRTLKLTIIDGFAGGGRYGYQGEVKYGSPLIIMEAVREASAILESINGQGKVNLDIDIICIEKNKNAVKSLESTLNESKYPQEKVRIWQGEFGQLLSRATEYVVKKSNNRKNGKCLFVLDQYGYTDVLGKHLRHIMQMNSEVILTFAIDALVAFLSKEKFPTLQKMGIGDLEIKRLMTLAYRPESCKAEIQFILANHIKNFSGAQFYTPFLIHSDKSNWGYWLVHLSKHPKARDVMTKIHWENASAHYGGSGVKMLEYNSRHDEFYTGQLFLGEEYRFDKVAKDKTMEVLPDDIVRFIHARGNSSFFELKKDIMNGTPASEDMIKDAILEGVKQEEIITSRRKAERIQDTDIIRPSPHKKIFTFSKKLN